MRQFRLIVVALLTFLFVVNTVFWQEAISNEKPTKDLTDIWLTERTKGVCRADRCVIETPSTPSLTVDGKTGIVSGAINISQSGKQFSIPQRKFVWDGGYYTLAYTKGTISGNTVTLDESAVNTSVGWGYTNHFMGTVSADGTEVTGEVTYFPSTCSDTSKPCSNAAKARFTWKRWSPKPGDVVLYSDSNGSYAHAAVIIEGGVKQNSDGTTTINRVRSKWGADAVYDHDPNVTRSYGKNWTVWSRNNKPESCKSGNRFLECNSLRTADCSHPESGKSGQWCYKTDKDRDIFPGGKLNPVDDPPGTGLPPGVVMVNPQPKEDPSSYDCRSFVFGQRFAVITDYYNVFVRHQVQEILDDGYTQLHAKDSEGAMHPPVAASN